MTSQGPAQPMGTGRDLRLDLVRGLTMVVIFIAHVPNNRWADFIPARFGFSSGAEIFVLCSGIASGLAFGGAYLRRGFAEGSRRVGRRMLQLYAAHLGLIAGLGGLALAVDAGLGQTVLEQRYELGLFREAPGTALIAYASLRYVPAFFDILPLYIVLLAFIPAIMALSARPRLALALSTALWLVTLGTRFTLPNLATGAGWYFNPAAWQLLFVLGFGWARGWWPVPALNRPGLTLVALAYVLAAIPLNFWWINDGSSPLLQSLHRAIYPDDAITVLHPTRLLHVLALAYLTLGVLEKVRPHLGSVWLRALIAVGQRSFPMFLLGLALSMAGGIALDSFGFGPLVTASVNAAGIAALLLAAHSLQTARGLRPGHQGTSLAATA